MTPRRAGVALIAASVAVGVIAGWFMPDPRWSLAAATAVTAATVGMGVGALWILRTSWVDRTWPPGGLVRSQADRARRSARVLGVILLTSAPIVLALLVWMLVARDGEWSRGLSLALVALAYTGLGAWLISRARADAADSVSRASHSRRPPDDVAAAQDVEGWRSIGPRSGAVITLAAIGPSAGLLVFVPLQLTRVAESGVWAIVALVAALAAAAMVFVALQRRFSPRTEVSVDSERIRAHRQEASWSEISSAELLANPPWEGSARTLVLTLRSDAGLRAPIVLRRREDLTLTDSETRLVLQIIDASSIDLPRAKEDPRGRFSKQLYPSNLTQAEARELVADPPSMSDPLPISGLS